MNSSDDLQEIYNISDLDVFQNDILSYEDIYKQHYLLRRFSLPLGTENKYLAVDFF